jgi:hypothetical protein
VLTVLDDRHEKALIQRSDLVERHRWRHDFDGLTRTLQRPEVKVAA